MTNRYVHGGGVDDPVVWYEGAGTTNKNYLHKDERGSVIALTDSAGDLIQVNRYDEWGVPAKNNIGAFQYTGQVWLADLGLYHYKARVYDPGLGRFLQADPIGYGDGMNMYAYVGGDPVNGRDPSGSSSTGTRLGDMLKTYPKGARWLGILNFNGPGSASGGGATIGGAYGGIFGTSTTTCVGCNALGIFGPGGITVTGPVYITTSSFSGGFGGGFGGFRSEPGHYFNFSEVICTPSENKSCDVQKTNSEICVLPNATSTDPIESGEAHVLFAGTFSRLQFVPVGRVRTSQVPGKLSFVNRTLFPHPFAGTISRTFSVTPGGGVVAQTVGQGFAGSTAPNIAWDKINQLTGPEIFRAQNKLCGNFVGSQ